MQTNERFCSNLLESIGNTPLVKLNLVTQGLKANIFAKLEFMNPGGSLKERIAKYMVEKAEKEGRLKSGATIIENSSGNTAIGLAIIAIQKGYQCKVVIRDTTSPEKIRILQYLGAETILVDASLPPENELSYNNYAQYLAEHIPDSVYIDQHNNPDNNEAHYMTTGPEIWKQLGGKIDYLVCGIGTGGTLFGAGRYLKEQNPEIKLIGLDPVGSVFYEFFKNKKRISPFRYKLEGLGDEFILKNVEFEFLDDMYQIDDDTAFEYTRELAKKEGIIAGGSSGANLYGAMRLAKEIDQPINIVTIFPDSGFRYMSSIFS